MLWSTRGRDAATPATVPRTVNHYAFTLEAPLFKYRARHGATTGAGLARTGVISTGLYVVPPHVAE
jgi:hypothetical protein